MHIGFTGTQLGMTPEQRATVEKLINNTAYTIAHHGVCVGADAEFHEAAKARGMHIIGHLPYKQTKVASVVCDEWREPLDYLDRNKEIVNESELLIAAPKGYQEELRSGTWSTVRYARKNNKSIIIVFPDGEIVLEKW